MPTGTLIRNTQRQDQVSVSQPPSIGPRIGAKMMPTATTENARPRCDGSNVSRMMDCWFGCSPPPKKPCSRRNTTSSLRLVAMPHRNEHTVNMATHSRKYCLRPSSRPNQPEIGSTMPLATR